MNLKTQYLIGTVGFIMMAWGGGMLFFSSIVQYPQFSTLNAWSFLIFGCGLAISIKMLSTMKKIEMQVEEE